MIRAAVRWCLTATLVLVAVACGDDEPSAEREGAHIEWSPALITQTGERAVACEDVGRSDPPQCLGGLRLEDVDLREVDGAEEHGDYVVLSGGHLEGVLTDTSSIVVSAIDRDPGPDDPADVGCGEREPVAEDELRDAGDAVERATRGDENVVILSEEDATLVLEVIAAPDDAVERYCALTTVPMVLRPSAVTS